MKSMNDTNKDSKKCINSKKKKAYHVVKRICDIIGAIILLTLTAPILLIVAILIKLESKGPILFKQSRIGKDGEPFTIYKFRSMYIDAPIKASNDFTDSKIHTTKIGGFLRKSSLDEFPQLVNVIRGEMSIIGPRPVIAIENDLIMLRRESGAETLTPGLTGWAQVNGRTQISNLEKAEYDAEYYEKQSLFFDIYILYRTFLIFLAGGEVKPNRKKDR